MNFTEEELEQIANQVKKDLREAEGELGPQAPSIDDIQTWMVKHHVEHPAVLQTVLSKLGHGSKVQKKNCPECGTKLKNQGLRNRQIHFGRLGLQTIKRTYYTCQNPDCKFTDYPLDRILGLSSRTATGKFEQQICRLSACMAFEHVQDYLVDQDQIEITETMIRETAEARGKSWMKYDEALQDSKEPIPTKTKVLYIQADGAMVPTKPENGEEEVVYKENKLGVIFREEDLERKDDGNCKIKKKRFASSLGKGVDHFSQVLQVAANRSGAAYAKEIVFLSDGADWLDNMCKRIFPRAIQILDWYHAAEHLWDCAKSLFPNNQEEREKWLKPIKQMLWDGLGEAVCERLLLEMKRFPKNQTPILALYNYYKPRIQKMRYEQFRRKGYFIGSGAVESANNYIVKARLCQSGMKWTEEGASAVIKLREKLYEKSWQTAWKRKAA